MALLRLLLSVAKDVSSIDAVHTVGFLVNIINLLLLEQRNHFFKHRNLQHTLGPSWSLRHLAAPRSVANLQRTLGPCWSELLLAAPRSVGPRFSWAYRQPTLCLLKLGKTIAAHKSVWRQQ